MLHDKDLTETKEHKTIHLHAFIELFETSKQPTKTALLNELSNLLEIDKNLISIEKTENDYLGVQYLTHKNDKSKYQYDYSNIKTNNETLLKQKYFTIYQKPNDIMTDILNCKTLTELMTAQGITIANKYRNTFNQIKTEQQQDYSSLESRYRRLWNRVDSLIDSVNMIIAQIDTLPQSIKDRLQIESLFNSYETLALDIYNERYELKNK